MSHVLEDFYNDNYDLLKFVNDGTAKTQNEDLRQFYFHMYQRKWKQDGNLANILINFINKNHSTIKRSLSHVGKTYQIENSVKTKLHDTKPFFQTMERVNDNTELSYQTDAAFPLSDLETIRTEFKRAETNRNPKIANSRYLVHNTVITDNIDQQKMDLIPSNSRNMIKATILGLEGYPYWEFFKPQTKQYNLYDPKQGRKFYGEPGTWMFDLLYFTNYGRKKTKDKNVVYKQVIYLVGININTRFAVARRIDGKSVKDLIPPFEDLLKKELKNNISLVIFDGEKAISSKKFEEFCLKHNISVRITYPGIHTQTAPIDRLCRTLRDYFTKMFMSKIFQGTEYNMTTKFNDYFRQPWFNNDSLKEALTTEGLYTRQIFDGTHSRLLAPIPIQYYKDMNGICYEYVPSETIWNGEVRDELYDVIQYYNNKQHHGLTKILKHAASTFGIPLNIRDEDITPNNVHHSIELERMVIQYSKYYNRNVKPSPQFNIGDKVVVYDCFTTDRGSLQRNERIPLMGDWEIVSKDNEIYGVRNNIDKQLLHVSKYMLNFV